MPSSDSNLRARRNLNVESGGGENVADDSQKKPIRQQPGLGKRMDVAVDIPLKFQVGALILMLIIIWMVAH